ncbi:MAG TPA: hypothetical protein DCZ80_07120 [Legionellales bacterium]|nr:hypothetical protein [Legionellales bacterium]
MNNKNTRPPLFFNTFAYASSLNAFAKKCHQDSPTISPPESPKNKVRFFNTIEVVLIPARIEYTEANLNTDLWFNDEEFKVIQQETIDELNQFLQKNPNCSKREALNKIYSSDQDDTEILGIKSTI